MQKLWLYNKEVFQKAGEKRKVSKFLLLKESYL